MSEWMILINPAQPLQTENGRMAAEEVHKSVVWTLDLNSVRVRWCKCVHTDNSEVESHKFPAQFGFAY